MPSKTFRTTHVEKTATVDHFATGCERESRTILCEPVRISAESFPELVRKAKEWAGGLDKTDYAFMPEGEKSEFFGFNQQENGDSERPTAAEVAAWKRGEGTLYLCDFTFAFEVVESSGLVAADLEGLTLG